MANVNTNGFIQDITILSTPNYVFGNQTLASYLGNVSVKIRVERSGGLSENITTTLLNLVGNTVTLTISLLDGSNPETMTFGLFEVQHNDPFPNYSTSIKLLKLAFSNWTFYNTELGQTYAVHFEYTQNFHPMSYKFAGEFVIDEIQKDIDTFYVNGYSSAVPASNGSLYDLFSHIKVIDNNQNEYDLWDLAKYGFTIKTNKSSYGIATTITGGNETIIRSATLGKFFIHCDTQNAFTKITITITYWDTTNEIDRTLTVEFNINLNGITTFTCSGLGDFVEQNANIGMVRTNIVTTNGMGYIDVPVSLENYFNSYTYSFLNTDTSQSYSTGDLLPNGHYTVTIGLVINPMWTKTASASINIYDGVASSISASLISDRYRVGTIFSDTNIIVYANYLIYGTSYHISRIYYPNYFSNYNGVRFTSNDYPSTTITITYDNLTTTVVAYTYYVITDEMWIFDKKTFSKSVYGEIEQGFNMNFVTDGTKDNAKVTIFNHISDDLKPFTIVYLVSTDTWWIVRNDKVTRYDNEENPLWQHDISLLGAIEIFNARDLTNCGFNVNKYTLGSFFTRLIKLCDCEFNVEFDYGTYLDEQKIIDYLKTFANYSPLSALKEMCDGLNVVPKMYFVLNNGETAITKAVIHFIPKSGTDDTIININEFDDSQELITNDKENYGSKVISNVKNVVSGKVIRYPAVGTVHISSNTNKVLYESAILRLPTKANYVESLEICGKYGLRLTKWRISTQEAIADSITRINGDCYNEKAFKTAATNLINNFGNADMRNRLNATTLNEMYEIVKKYGHITLQNGADYIQDSYSGGNWTGNWNGKQVELEFRGSLQDYVSGHPGIGPSRSNSIGLNDKKHYDTFPQPICMIYWEQGSDLIKNFQFYDKFTNNQNDFTYAVNLTDKLLMYSEEGDFLYELVMIVRPYTSPVAGMGLTNVGINLISTYEATYVVHYIPMTDMKLKVENGNLENDSHLYNQNGTLVSSKAVSKLINSHAKSISSNHLTRYKRYYDFFSIPSVGQVVNNNGVYYVINNVSIDFAENDNNQYVLDCQFTLTKQVACNSIMINANTNIRDYDTPQEHNIYRVQNYRDYIKLSYELENADELYMPFDNLFYFPSPFTYGVSKGYVDTHTAVMKIQWAQNDINYYQLPCIKYELEKMIVEVIDFKDNNIIGYAVNNSTHPFQISTWWVKTDLIQVPVSYVDEIGHLIGLEILMCDNDQLTTAYNTLESQYSIDVSSLYSASCIVPEELYTTIGNNYDAIISENDYDKDGLEIPMFIYSCQIGDNEGIVVSGDFFNSETLNENEFYVYGYYIVEDTNITEENAIGNVPQSILPTININSGNVNTPQEVYLSIYNEETLSISLYKNSTYSLNNGAYVSRTTSTDPIYNKNVIIFRCKMNRNENDPLETQFVMAINHCKSQSSLGNITLYINKYQLN